jgi:hypothetical protein
LRLVLLSLTELGSALFIPDNLARSFTPEKLSATVSTLLLGCPAASVDLDMTTEVTGILNIAIQHVG